MGVRITGARNQPRSKEKVLVGQEEVTKKHEKSKGTREKVGRRNAPHGAGPHQAERLTSTEYCRRNQLQKRETIRKGGGLQGGRLKFANG